MNDLKKNCLYASVSVIAITMLGLLIRSGVAPVHPCLVPLLMPSRFDLEWPKSAWYQTCESDVFWRCQPRHCVLHTSVARFVSDNICSPRNNGLRAPRQLSAHLQRPSPRDRSILSSLWLRKVTTWTHLMRTFRKRSARDYNQDAKDKR